MAISITQNLHSDTKIKRNFYKNFSLSIPNKNSDLVGFYAIETVRNSKLISSHRDKTGVYNDLKELFPDNNKSILGIAKYSEVFDNQNYNILETFDNKHHQRFVYQIAGIV